MMIKNKLIHAIFRSEKAYLKYDEHQLFFQALRIYNANQALYQLLEAYQLECADDHLDDICNYIYHLEDWMNQFDQQRKTVKLFTDRFVFLRWNHAIAFPEKFVEQLRS